MWWLELALVAVGAVGLVVTTVLDNAERKVNRALWQLFALGLALMASWKLVFAENSVLFPAHAALVSPPTLYGRLRPFEKLWRPQESEWYLWVGKYGLWAMAALFALMTIFFVGELRREAGAGKMAATFGTVSTALCVAAWWV